MTTWFTHGFLRLGKKRAQSLDDSGDKENSGPHYPTMKKAKKKKTSPFAGATPADTGSWILCQDREGRMYWWNDVTGHWTYQLYSSSSPHLQQQHHHHQRLQQHHHQMMPRLQQQQQQLQHQVSFSQQHTAHLSHHHYSPNGAHHLRYDGSPPLGPVVSPHMWQQQQQQQAWGLLSPSAHAAGLPAATAVGSFDHGWGFNSFSDEGGEDFARQDDEENDAELEEEEEEVEAWAAEKKAGGTWDKFYNNKGHPIWIHSKTGSRTTVNPATV